MYLVDSLDSQQLRCCYLGQKGGWQQLRPKENVLENVDYIFWVQKKNILVSGTLHDCGTRLSARLTENGKVILQFCKN